MRFFSTFKVPTYGLVNKCRFVAYGHLVHAEAVIDRLQFTKSNRASTVTPSPGVLSATTCTLPADDMAYVLILIAFYLHTRRRISQTDVFSFLDCSIRHLDWSCCSRAFLALAPVVPQDGSQQGRHSHSLLYVPPSRTFRSK